MPGFVIKSCFQLSPRVPIAIHESAKHILPNCVIFLPLMYSAPGLFEPIAVEDQLLGTANNYVAAAYSVSGIGFISVQKRG